MAELEWKETIFEWSHILISFRRICSVYTVIQMECSDNEHEPFISREDTNLCSDFIIFFLFFPLFLFAFNGIAF